jgi:hypothetical protein
VINGEAYKHFGVLATLILAVGLGFIIKRWPSGKNRTFSQHIAASRQGIVYYIGLFAVVLPILLLFFLRWFIPTNSFSWVFISAIVGAAILQFLCTLVPEVGGWKSTVHRFLAFTSAILLLVPIALIAISSNVSTVAMVVALLSFTAMSGIVLFLVAKNAEHESLLIIQTSYYALFFLAILSATYL